MNRVKINENTLDFAEIIMSDIKSSKEDGVLKCVQCGMCTSTCPAARHSNYNPREMIERVLEGDDSILEDEYIWNCFYCYTCHSTCPVGNSASEINQIIKQLAISKEIGFEKLIPFLGFGDSYLSMAIGGIPSNFFEEIKEDVGDEWWDLKMNLDEVRKELDLGPVSPPKEVVDEVNKLLVNCGFKERVDKIRKSES